MFALLSPGVSSYAGEPASATLDALSAAMEQGDLRADDLSKVFDGGISHSVLPVTDAAVPGAAPAAPARAYKSVSLAVPMPALIEKGLITTAPIYPHEEGIMAKAKAAIASTPAGQPLADFSNAQNVTLLWDRKGFLDASPYAFTAPPGPEGKKTIHLAWEYRNLLTDISDPNFTFLSSIIAHELTHQSDFVAAEITDRDTLNKSVRLLLELNAFNKTVYIYNQQRQAKKTAPPKLETRDLQMLRLYADIYNYMNGWWPYPRQSDFLQIQKIGELTFDRYVKEVTKSGKRGIWSLAGVVEDLYQINSAFEAPPKPGLFGNNKEYKQYKAIEKSLNLAADKYNKWLNPPAPQAPVAPPQQPVQPPPVQPQQPQQPQHPKPPLDDNDDSEPNPDTGSGGPINPGPYNPHFHD